MKSLEQQITFLDRQLLSIFGFKSIMDYTTIITVSMLENIPNFIQVVNDILATITDVYPVKKFNLHKTDHQVLTHSQAFNILVQCLELSEIPHLVWTELHNRKTIRYLRLSDKNKTLEMYIQNKMSEKRSFIENEKSVSASGSGSKKERDVLSIDQVKSMSIGIAQHQIIYPITSNCKYSDGSFGFDVDLTNTWYFPEAFYSNISFSFSQEIQSDWYNNGGISVQFDNYAVPLVPFQNVLPNNFTSRCKITIKINRNPKDFAGNSLICNYTGLVHTAKDVDVIQQSVITGQFAPNVKLGVEYPSEQKLTVIEIMALSQPTEIGDWSDVPDNESDNEAYLIKCFDRSRNIQKLLPFVKIIENKDKNHKLIDCRARHWNGNSLIMVAVHSLTPISVVGRVREQIKLSPVIFDKIPQMYYSVPKFFDLIDNLCLTTDDAPIIESIKFVCGDMSIYFNKTGDHTYQLPDKPINLCRFHNYCLSITLKCLPENITSNIHIEYDGYIMDTEYGRKLSLNELFITSPW